MLQKVVLIILLIQASLWIGNFRSSRPCGKEVSPPYSFGRKPEPQSLLRYRDDTFYSHQKYLVYSPHSGFHNQRVALENAIMLSVMLNRTLVVPPVIFGHDIPWKRFENMWSSLREAFNIFHSWKSNTENNSRPLNLLLSWLRIFDLEELSYSWNSEFSFVTFEEIELKFNVNFTNEDPFQESNVNQEADVVYIKDYSSRAYRLVDLASVSLSNIHDTSLQEYDALIDINQLNSEFQIKYVKSTVNAADTVSVNPNTTLKAPQFLFFGSLFGSNRLLLGKGQENELSSLQSKLIYKNSLIKSVASRIQMKLGGAMNYIGIHVRTTGRIFVHRISETVHFIRSEILDYLGSEFEQDVNTLFQPSDWHMYKQQRDQNCLPTEFTSSSFRWGKANLPATVPIIFMAIDTMEPWIRDEFTILYRSFKCIYTLDDFGDEIQALYKSREDDREDLHFQAKPPSSYSRIWSQKDIFTEFTGGLFVPFIDQLVAAQGKVFFGTKKSTFSAYGQRMNKILREKKEGIN